MGAQTKYLNIGNALLDFSGKDVLEAGGCVLPEEIRDLAVKSWTAIDINERRFENVNGQSLPDNYKFKLMSICDTDFADNSFDCIYSVNCFEHVNDLAQAFREMYRILRPGGHLYTIFGPIWSGPFGHHTYVTDNDGKVLNFADGLFPNWYHLMKTKAEMSAYLQEHYEQNVVNKMISYIYDSDDLNRLIDKDYEDLIYNSEFSKQICIRNKKGAKLDATEMSSLKKHYPAVINPRISEYLLVLKKGKPALLETSAMFFRLGKWALCKKLKG